MLAPQLGELPPNTLVVLVGSGLLGSSPQGTGSAAREEEEAEEDEERPAKKKKAPPGWVAIGVAIGVSGSATEPAVAEP